MSDDEHPWAGTHQSSLAGCTSGAKPDDSEDDEEQEHDPTHECVCGRQTYIESSPTKDYKWCPDCESVTRHRRIR